MQQLSLMDIINNGLHSYQRAAGARAFRVPATRSEHAASPPPAPTAEAHHTRVNTDALRRSAEKIQERINFCLAPRRENTRKRRQEAENFQREADNLEKLKAKLLAVASAHDAGTVAPILQRVTTKAQVEALNYWSKMPTFDQWNGGAYKTLTRAGIFTDEQLEEASRALAELGSVELSEEERRARRIKELERKAAGSNIPGYFPTPHSVVWQVLSLADVRAGHTVLEPSAGSGNIADALLPIVGAGLDVIEINYSLQEILQLRGHNIVGDDFLECQRRYDRICMNPPFERGQDIEHVRHAYSLLLPGGRLISVMSEGTFYRQDRKATEFRQWLDGLDMYGINIDAGAFKESGTNVAARIILINNKSR